MRSRTLVRGILVTVAFTVARGIWGWLPTRIIAETV